MTHEPECRAIKDHQEPPSPASLGALALSLPEFESPHRAVSPCSISYPECDPLRGRNGRRTPVLERHRRVVPSRTLAGSRGLHSCRGAHHSTDSTNVQRTLNVEGMTFSRRIILTTTDDTLHVVDVGRRVPGSSGHYLQVDGETWVSTGELPPPLTVDGVLDKRVLPFKRHEAAHIRLGPIELERTHW